MRLHRSNRASWQTRAAVLAVTLAASAAIIVEAVSNRQVAAESPPASAKPDAVKSNAAAPEPSADKQASPAAADAAPAPAPAGEHPLDPALVIARRLLDHLTNDVKD